MSRVPAHGNLEGDHLGLLREKEQQMFLQVGTSLVCSGNRKESPWPGAECVLGKRLMVLGDEMEKVTWDLIRYRKDMGFLPTEGGRRQGSSNVF